MDPQKIAEASRWLGILNQLYTSETVALLDPFDLTPTQFGILNHICAPSRQKGQRISQIARAVQAGQPAVTKIMAKFEAQGLVRSIPDETDKRARIVVPTPFALARMQEVQLSMADRMGEMWSAVPTQRLDELTNDLRALAAWLDENRPED